MSRMPESVFDTPLVIAGTAIILMLCAFALAGLLLGETVTWPMLAASAAVAACVAAARRFAR